MVMMSVTNNMLLVQGPHSRFNLLSSTTGIVNIFPFSHSQSRTRSNRLFVDCNASRKAGIYTKTTPDRKLRTPHSGYHFDGSTRRFFEGWYFKVSLPEQRESFCFMYSDEDPAFSQNLGCGQEILNGQRFPGIGAQILGPEDKYICQYSNEVQNFWGSEHDLALGNTFLQRKGSLPPMEETYPQEFQTRVEEGFQVTPTWHQGFIRDDGRSNYTSTVKTARWEYSTKPVYGWGDVNSRQKATAGWLAAFPIFEPHWQICMAGGLSTGWIEWDKQLFEFENAPSYSEKNWGGSFPEKWFWVQCNVFEGAHGEVALTAGGGKRLLLGRYEDVAMIGIHYDGKFYEFVPWSGFVQWKILPWGSWQMKAQNNLYEVELVAATKSTGTILRAPSKNAGLAPSCKDTCHGDLNLKIWEHPEHGERGKVILDVTSDMAALETGGGPWYECYEKKSISPPLLKQLVGLPLEMEEISKRHWNVGTKMKVNATCKLAFSQGTQKVDLYTVMEHALTLQPH